VSAGKEFLHRGGIESKEKMNFCGSAASIDGFVLADQLRQEEKEKNSAGIIQMRVNTPADFLEQTLISEVACDHFEAAMKYVRAMPDDAAKLAAFARIIEALRQNIF